MTETRPPANDPTPKAVQDCHELLLWLIPVIDQFPRVRRFTLGERLENGVLDLLDALTSAAYAKDKSPYLARASQRLNLLLHLWRVCFELRVIPARRYEHGARLFAALGQQVGGWQRFAARPPA